MHVTDTHQRPPAAAAKKDAVKELASLDWHLLLKDEVLQRLSVDPKVGLDGEQAKRRLATNGPNTVSPPPNRAWLKSLNSNPILGRGH